MVSVRVEPRLLPERAATATMSALGGAGGYDGGSLRGSLRTFFARAGGPRSDTLPSLTSLRARSRDLERNNPLATGTLSTVATNVVGTGIFPMPRLDPVRLGLKPERTAEIELAMGAEFDLWADTTLADDTSEQDFWGLQDLTLRSQLLSGDCFSVPRYDRRGASPYELAVQVIEADRCCNPPGRGDGSIMPNGAELVGGIEIDKRGRAVAYWFADRHPGEVLRRSLRYERLPAWGPNGNRSVFHHFRRLRPGQTRGVPYFAPVIALFKDLGRYTEAEIMAAVLSACFAMTTTSEGGDGADVSGDEEEAGTGVSDTLRRFDPGLTANLMPGQQIASFMPNRPNQAFDPFVLAMLRQIGVALELPYEVLVKHFTASYSAARAALLEAWKMFRARRAWLAGSFCQPYYERWLIEASALSRPGIPDVFGDYGRFRAWSACEWIGPSPGQIDELKEAEAAKLRVDEEFSTREEETARLTGGDWRQKHRQRVIEEQMRRRDGTATAPRPVGPANAVREDTPDRPEQQDAA
ncbi:phage portal protein [Reyranella sp.]|uniref:phage portal protein n=1 Tax=Reyranella sp. TaxID=1929291 RepID=UPI003BACFD01